MIAYKFFPRLFLQRAYSVRSSLPVPVIKVPKYVTQHVDKRKRKGVLKDLSNENRKKIAYRGDTSVPVISSNKGDFNHYLGQLYHDNYPLPIQSKFWFKAKTSGQKFTIHPYDSNPSLPSSDPNEYIDDEYFPNEFTKLKLNDNIINSLYNEFKFEKPTRIQTLVIPRILSGRHVLVASETGGGKTISYLAPIIHKISSLKKTMTVHPDTPLGLIIVPGRELAEQIGDVAYRLANGSNVNVKALVSDGTRLKHLKVLPYSQIDLLVASFGCLVKLFRKGKFKLSNLHHLVLDEADTLLDDSFIEDTQFILQRLTVATTIDDTTDATIASFKTQLVLASSIYPSNVHSIFCDEFKDENFTKVCSPYLHRVPMHIEQKFWRVSNDGRSADLLQLVKNDYEKKRSVMIFCNKSTTCDWLSLFLDENGVSNAKFHGGVDPLERSAIFRAFQNGSVNVLCCTDLASRGLDTQRVKHVINFDFPNNVSDYLLRAGRVGRVGTNHGLVTSLVVSPSGIFTVHDIEKAVRSAKRISGVDSNIKQKIRKLFFTH